MMLMNLRSLLRRQFNKLKKLSQAQKGLGKNIQTKEIKSPQPPEHHKAHRP